MTPKEIAQAPAPVLGKRTTDLWHLTCQSSNWDLLGKSRTVNEFMVAHFERQRQMALRHHAYANNSVLYHHGDYRQAPDVECCWFIDPPYEDVRNGYRCKDIDYDELAEWCMTRKGQVIICEGRTGSWLPFEYHKSFRTSSSFATQRPKVDTIEHKLVRRTHARCVMCSMTFPATRADARYCSGKCRTRASRVNANAKR